ASGSEVRATWNLLCWRRVSKHALRTIPGGAYGFPCIPAFQNSAIICARSFFECGLANSLKLSHAKRPAESSLAREGGSGSAGRFACATRLPRAPSGDREKSVCGQAAAVVRATVGGQGRRKRLRESPADEYRV